MEKLFKKKNASSEVVGIFEVSNNHKSVNRVLVFMSTTLACAIILFQEIMVACTASVEAGGYERSTLFPALLLSFAAGTKLAQKHLETRAEKKSESKPESDEEIEMNEISDLGNDIDEEDIVQNFETDFVFEDVDMDEEPREDLDNITTE